MYACGALPDTSCLRTNEQRTTNNEQRTTPIFINLHTITPILLLSMIQSLLIRHELYRSSHHLLHYSLYNINLLLHSILLVCVLALSVLSYWILSYYLISAHSAFALLPTLMSASLLNGSVALLELNVYWILIPSLTRSSTNHVSVEILIVSLLIINFSTVVHSVSTLQSAYAVTSISNSLMLISLSLVLLTATASSIVLSTYLYLLSELSSSYTIFQYLCISCLHIIWMWGHIEVYILCIPQLLLCLTSLLNTSNVTVYDENTVAVSCINIVILSSLTWAHHLYSLQLLADLINLCSSISLCIALSTASKITVLITSYSYSSSTKLASGNSLILSTITCGGLSGVFITLYAMNSHVHCTSAVFSHCHIILSTGFLISLLLCIDLVDIHLSVYHHTIIVLFLLPSMTVRRVHSNVAPTQTTNLIL